MRVRTFKPVIFLLVVLALSACSSPSPGTPLAASTHTSTPSALPSFTYTPRPTITRAATLTPTITKELLEMEIVDSAVFQDSYGNTRVTVSVRNPYDFAVETEFRPRATLYDSDGNVLSSQQLLEDGVYGNMLFQPGSTHHLFGCFDPCDGGVPVGEWKTYSFVFILKRLE